MKKLFLLLLSITSISISQAQVVKTNGTSDKATVVLMNDPSRVDFFPSLIYLDQHPLPAAAYGNKKQELDRLRAIREAELKEQGIPQQKTRGLAPNPVEIKGIQGNIASGVPNDNDIAVSNSGIVISVVNSNMRVYDDTGKVLGNTSLTSLTSSIGTFSWISDPRVIYDPKEDRFILVCFSGSVSTSSTILVGFTQTNNPMGAWNFYTLNGNSFNDSTWSDYPIIAISDKDLFITFNQVKDNVSWTIGFKQSVIWQIDKQTGLTGVPLQYTLWSGIKHNDGYLRNICPAKYQSATMGNNMYFLTLRNVDFSNDSIFVAEITNSQSSGTATLVQRVLKSPINYGFPPNARQKHPVNGIVQHLMTNDGRVLAAIYENDYIHFGSNSVNTQYMNAGVMLSTIKNISSATPTVTADIISTATMEYGYPSMTYVGSQANEHRVLYTFSHCVTDSFPGTSVVYKDENENYSDILRIKNGESYINMIADSNERWGDYTNIQKMYNKPSRAYLAGSFGKGSAMNCWISVLDVVQWPLTVNTIEEKSTTTIYPNPIEEKRFKVQFTNSTPQQLKFELSDMNGKLVATLLQTIVKEGKNEFSFYTGNISAGTYLFSIKSEKSVIETHKIVVQ